MAMIVRPYLGPTAAQRELDRLTDTPKQTVSRLLTRLQRYGLIQDSGIGPTKGMARAWSPTPRGEGVLDATRQR
jgi:hypothetical protein